VFSGRRRGLAVSATPHSAGRAGAGPGAPLPRNGSGWAGPVGLGRLDWASWAEPAGSGRQQVSQAGCTPRGPWSPWTGGQAGTGRSHGGTGLWPYAAVLLNLLASFRAESSQVSLRIGTDAAAKSW
jgi:hypothetical protein